MSKKARPADEIGKYKKHILDTAVNLIVNEGYDKFSMRKLASVLGISATAIYDYYPNKEELYLNVLIEGFEELSSKLIEARDKYDTPTDRFRAITHAYIDFGINRANLYNLMLVWNVPKYYDFVGKPAESLAFRELQSALKMRDISVQVISSCKGILFDEETQVSDVILKIMCSQHGFITFYNSHITDYLTDPIGPTDQSTIIERYVDSLFKK